MDIECTIQDLIVGEATKRWGEDLMSVVLFGSMARGNTHIHSDIDLLVIAKNLPKGWRERGALELSFEQMGLQWGRALQVILIEPDDVQFAVNNIMSLLLEIRENYHCLLDRDKFFQSEMQRFGAVMDECGVRKLSEHKWEIPELV